MLKAAGMGLLVSGVVGLTASAQTIAQGLPIGIIGVFAFVAALLQRSWIEKRSFGRIYEGLADFFMSIHVPSIPEMGWKWFIRGCISFMLAIVGGLVGIEAAAIEFSYAYSLQLRSHADRWFEHRRRTDSAAILAAGISAAFGAPFAGFIVPMEMGIGGRTLASVTSSIFAFLGIHFLKILIPIKTFSLDGALYGFELTNPQQWIAVILIAFGAALLGILLPRFVRYFQNRFLDLAQGCGWIRMILGGIVLVLVAACYQGGFLSGSILLEDVLWARRAHWESALAFFARSFSLAVVLATFGTMGIFWPLFTLGGLFGYSIYEIGFHSIHIFGATSGLIGAASFWGAILGTPIAASVLVYELTQNVQVMIPAWIAATVAKELVRFALGKWSLGLVDMGLEVRGLPLNGGRSVRVLEGIRVKDAMVVDHETVFAHEPVSELRPKLLQSRYPYLAVIDLQGHYQGMLTFDMVRDAWDKNQSVITSRSLLSQLLEVKDLLYRSDFIPPTIEEQQKLSEVTGVLDKHPCVSVVDSEGRVLGLLLVQNVRQAYDREVIRTSLDLAIFNTNR